MFGNERHDNQVQHGAYAIVLAARSRKPMVYASSVYASWACVIGAPAMTWSRCGPGPDTR